MAAPSRASVIILGGTGAIAGRGNCGLGAAPSLYLILQLVAKNPLTRHFSNLSVLRPAAAKLILKDACINRSLEGNRWGGSLRLAPFASRISLTIRQSLMKSRIANRPAS